MEYNFIHRSGERCLFYLVSRFLFSLIFALQLAAVPTYYHTVLFLLHSALLFVSCYFP